MSVAPRVLLFSFLSHAPETFDLIWSRLRWKYPEVNYGRCVQVLIHAKG